MVTAFSRSRRTVAAMILAVAAMGLPGTAAAVTVGTTTTLSATPNPWPYCAPITWSITVTPDGPADGSSPTGSVVVYDVTNGGHSQVATGTLSAGSSAVSISGWTCIQIGAHDLVAEFTSTNPAYANSSSSPAYSLTVGASPSWTEITGLSTIEQHGGANLTYSVNANLDIAGGTIALYLKGNSTPLCTAIGNAEGGGGTCPIPDSTIGTATYYATYTSPDHSVVLDSQSADFVVTTTPDTVHAHGVTIQYTTIYPTTDGYRDTDRLSGVRDELLTTSIKIYNSSNTLVRSATIAAGTGAYSYLWNGRNTSGTILAEGTYKVVTKFTDAYGTTKTYNNSIALSKKQLIWHSSSVTKLGSSISAYGHANGGTVSVNTTSGYARIYAPSIFSDWAGAGWQLTLPTAVSYRYLAMKVYAKERFTAGQDVRLGAQNFSTCGYSSTWDESCFDTWHSIGNTYGTLAWYSTGGLTSVHRYGHALRAMVSDSGGTVYVYKVQATFQYSTLGY